MGYLFDSQDNRIASKDILFVFITGAIMAICYHFVPKYFTKSYDFLNFNELNYVIEKDITDNHYKTAATFLLSALNDWPTLDLKEPKDLIKELRFEMKDKLTFKTLTRYSNQMDIKVNHGAWKIEAIASLLELFDFERKNKFDKTIELEEIIDNLTKYYRQKMQLLTVG